MSTHPKVSPVYIICYCIIFVKHTLKWILINIDKNVVCHGSENDYKLTNQMVKPHVLEHIIIYICIHLKQHFSS